MTNDSSHKRQDVIAEEAANYLIELQSPRPETKAEFAAWLKTSPEHVNEFLAVAALWGALPEVSEQPSIEALVELAAGEHNVVELGPMSKEAGAGGLTSPERAESIEPSQGNARSRRGHWRFGLAAAMFAAAMVATVLVLRPPATDPNLYTTAIGEQTSLPLPDGSLVTLNTLSTLRVAYSNGFRDIHLTRGEALFDVAKDPDRPFRVITEHAVIQAVGTQFNVRSYANDVTVTVVEGIVDVSATTLGPLSGEAARLPDDSSANLPTDALLPTRLTVGQQATVVPQSSKVAVVETTIDKATAWRERRLVFESLSLADVIDEFNRYNTPPLLIDEPELRALPISGVFRANDRESFVAFLAQMQLATAHTRDDGVIVLRKVSEE